MLLNIVYLQVHKKHIRLGQTSNFSWDKPNLVRRGYWKVRRLAQLSSSLERPTRSTDLSASDG